MLQVKLKKKITESIYADGFEQMLVEKKLHLFTSAFLEFNFYNKTLPLISSKNVFLLFCRIKKFILFDSSIFCISFL